MGCELLSRSLRDWSTISIQTNKWIRGSIAQKDDSDMRSSHMKRNETIQKLAPPVAVQVGRLWCFDTTRGTHPTPDARTHIASGRVDQNKCTINAKRGIIVCRVFLKDCVFQTLVKRCGVGDLVLVGWGPEFTPARNHADI